MPWRPNHGCGLRRQHPGAGRARPRGRIRRSDEARCHRLRHRGRRVRSSDHSDSSANEIRLSDCLFLPLPQRSGGIRELSGWEASWMPVGEGEAERLTIGMGGGWQPIEVPRQLAAHEGSQAVWYRTEVQRPDHSGRVLLRIGGAFLATHAWLNGKLLGSHYGYFATFGFDLTPYLKQENLLVICCESPVETQPEKKRHVMGIFNDGELKPYPASAYSSLPEPYRWEVPVGIWGPVGLEYIGPIAVDWMRLNPHFEAGNGRPMFLRGACYAPAYRLDELTPERFDADLRIAKEANVDALRVLANVLPLEFYRRADEAGMLLLQELPLLGAYAYHSRGDDARFFDVAAKEQQAEMVELLRNRPSVAMWVAHDDPPWLAANAELGDVNAVRQNHSIDQELRTEFVRMDKTRPALAASGEIDEHALLGWATGSWRAITEAEPVMVTAFGAQALPSTDSPVWEQIDARWPVADDDAAWRFAGFQPVNWAERGVGLPSAHSDLESYIKSSQSFQANLVRLAAEH